MAAPAKSLEASTARAQAEHISKPWLQNGAAAVMRAAENPSSMRHHLKTIAERNNKHFGEAWESSRKSTQVIFATLHAEDDKVYKKSGKARFAQKDPTLQYMSRMDYTKFLETALDESQQALTSSPSFTIQDMRRVVESKVAWLPKLEDLYRSESQESLPGDHLVKRMMKMAGPPLGSGLSAGGCTGGTAMSAATVSRWKKLSQHSQTQSVVVALRRSAHASSKRFVGLEQASTAPAHASGEAPAAGAGVGVGADFTAAAALPWENSMLLSRRAVRHDALRDRLQVLDRRVARRRVVEHNPNDEGAWVKQSPQLAAVPATVALGNRDSFHGGERVHVPTDAELLAMEPVNSLRVLRECELLTLALLTGVKQTWKERVKQCRGKRLVLLQGGDGIHQDDQLRSRYNSYLLEVLELLTAKRKVVVRHVVSELDTVAKVQLPQVVGREVASVMMRKKKMDADEAMLRQTLRRQDEEDAAQGRGYVAVRFGDRPRTCPAG